MIEKIVKDWYEENFTFIDEAAQSQLINLLKQREQTVADALVALRERLHPALFYTKGTYIKAMAEFDATRVALNLPAPTPTIDALPLPS